MALAADATDAQFGPWNPGIQSQVPAHLRHYCTIFRSENVFTNVASAGELRDLTGLEFRDLVAFQPQRLALHAIAEVLDHHLKCFAARDIDGVLPDYSADAVFFWPRRTRRAVSLRRDSMLDSTIRVTLPACFASS